MASDLGLEYGLEVVNRYETNLLNTAYQVSQRDPSSIFFWSRGHGLFISLGILQAMELVDAVGAPNIGVHLDTYHMNIEENNFENAIKLCGDKLQ